MKKESVFILFLFFVSLASAVPSLEIYGENFQPYETVVGNISGVSQNLDSSSLKFFEGRREVSFEKDLIAYEGIYYFSVVFNREGNFSLKLENVLYYEGENLNSASLEENFEIKYEGENFTRILSIKPGVVFTTGDFDLTLKNVGEDLVNFSYGEKNKSSLESGESEKISLSPSANFSVFEVKSYKDFFVPIIYFNITQTNNTVEEKVLSLKPAIEALEFSFFVGDKLSSKIELFNFGEENLTDVSVKTELDFVKTNLVKEIEGKSVVNLSLEGTLKNTGLFKDNLTISYTENGSEEKVLIPLTVYVFAANSSEEEVANSLDCFSLGGEICDSGEFCEGTNSTRVDKCCVGSCKKLGGDEGSSKVVVGLLIISFLGIVGYVIYKKYKNVKPQAKPIS
jgi:preprotein translocase subunit Sss1